MSPDLPSNLGLIITTVLTSPNDGTLVTWCLLSGPISSGYRWRHDLFIQRKDSYTLFPVDGSLALPMTFFEELKLRILLVYFIAREKLLVCCWDWTLVPAGNNFTKRNSPSELVSPGCNSLFWNKIFQNKLILCQISEHFIFLDCLACFSYFPYVWLLTVLFHRPKLNWYPNLPQLTKLTTKLAVVFEIRTSPYLMV